MKDSTETLTMFAQLLETQPPILPPTAREQVRELAAKLADISETETRRAAHVIIEWIEQFPQEQEIFVKALEKNRKELDEISDPNPNDFQWTIPNFQIIEDDPETKQDMVLITPAPEETQKISLLSYIRQSLSQWIQKNQ